VKYRKKPVVIEAVQYDGHNFAEISAWAGITIAEKFTGGLLIDTLEGQMRADLGDWVIKGVQGEFYPCKPGIFEATYEPVENDS
jgi:hypothetical protein